MKLERDDLILTAHMMAMHAGGELWPSAVAAHVYELKRLAGPMRRIYERACDYPTTPREAARLERLQSEARKLCKVLGVSVRFNSDPRGQAIRLTWGDPSKQPSNNWGGDDWSV